jgi:hypothetical protein
VFPYFPSSPFPSIPNKKGQKGHRLRGSPFLPTCILSSRREKSKWGCDLFETSIPEMQQYAAGEPTHTTV